MITYSAYSRNGVRIALAKTKDLVDQGKSLDEILTANLTAAYDATTKGDTPASKNRFITEAYNEVKDK